VTVPDSIVPEAPKVDALLRQMRDLLKAYAPQDIEYEMRKLRGYRDALFEHFAPFKVGDYVRMHRTYEIPSDSGWKGYDETMVVGATAEVRNVDWLVLEHLDWSGWTIGVLFDEEIYTTKWGSEPKVYRRSSDDEEDHRGLFQFRNPDRYFELAGDPT
jgi:hypothetical protein